MPKFPLSAAGGFERILAVLAYIRVVHLGALMSAAGKLEFSGRFRRQGQLVETPYRPQLAKKSAKPQKAKPVRRIRRPEDLARPAAQPPMPGPLFTKPTPGRPDARPLARRSAHRLRQGDPDRPLSAAGRKLPGHVRPRRLRLCRRCRPCPAALRRHEPALVHAGDAGPVEWRHQARPADLLLPQRRVGFAGRHRRHLERECVRWPPMAAASAPIGARSAPSARR